MMFHIHTLRGSFGAALGAIVSLALLGGAYASHPAAPGGARVTGRVTCGGRPLGGRFILFEQIDPGGSTVASTVMADGSFHLGPRQNSGLQPGAYRVHFFRRTTDAPDPLLPAKYLDPRTSGLLVHVGPDWNAIEFALPGPRSDRGPASPG